MINEKMTNKNKQRFKILTISIWITVAFWVSMFVLSTTNTPPSDLSMLILLIGVINGWVYLIYLGLLVSQSGKSVLMWVIGTMCFSVLGIGPVISYFRIKTIAIQNGWD